MVRFHLALDRLPVVLGFLVKILFSFPSPDRLHRLHPKVIGIRTDSLDGVAKTDFDLETVPIGFYQFQGIEGRVRTHQNHSSPRGVNHPDETNQPSDRSPQEDLRSIPN